MKHTAKALLLSLTVTTAAAALIIPAATAETVAETPDFKTFEATPKAPRKEPVKERQIVVEPKQEIAPKTDTTPIANLTDPVETVDTKQPEPEQKLVESTEENEDKPAIEDKPGLDEDTFAPKTKAEADKVEMPTVFTEKQKELFEKLDAEQQADLVKKLVKKHGYDTMYPK
ncbi:MAG: hypothetical protein ACR2OM_13590, partial [Aestuariivirgaceae bacterium]